MGGTGEKIGGDATRSTSNFQYKDTPCKKQSMKKERCFNYHDKDPGAADKVIDRLTAMYELTDCCLVSYDGVSFPVHKAKLLEQSKVLRYVQASLFCTST